MADYQIPPYPVSRLRYFDGQFLIDQDFADDQRYHVAQSRRHERLLHVSGITEGLTVTKSADGKTLFVAPGSAVDDAGQHILLAEEQTLAVGAALTGTLFVEVKFEEEATNAQSGQGASGETRWTQKTEPASIKAVPTPGAIVLAELTLSPPGTVLEVKTGVRVYSGLRLPGPANVLNQSKGALRSRGDASPGWAELECSLRVAGASTWTGAVSAEGGLTVTGGGLTLGTTTANQTLSVFGTASVSSSVSVGGSLTVAGGALTLGSGAVNQSLVVNGPFSATGSGSVGGALTVGGGLTVTGGPVTVGTTSVNQTLTVNGLVNANKGLTVTGGALTLGTNTAYQNLFVFGVTNIGAMLYANGGLTVSGLGLTVGSTAANQSIGLNGDLNVTGVVNFGTTTPRQMLNLLSTTYAIGVQTSTYYFRSPQNFAFYRGGVHHNDPFQPGAGGSVVMVMDGVGNVGIGTTGPGAKLDVVGDVRFSRETSAFTINRNLVGPNFTLLYWQQKGRGVEFHVRGSFGAGTSVAVFSVVRTHGAHAMSVKMTNSSPSNSTAQVTHVIKQYNQAPMSTGIGSGVWSGSQGYMTFDDPEANTLRCSYTSNMASEVVIEVEYGGGGPSASVNIY